MSFLKCCSGAPMFSEKNVCPRSRFTHWNFGVLILVVLIASAIGCSSRETESDKLYSSEEALPGGGTDSMTSLPQAESSNQATSTDEPGGFLFIRHCRFNFQNLFADRPGGCSQIRGEGGERSGKLEPGVETCSKSRATFPVRKGDRGFFNFSGSLSD